MAMLPNFLVIGAMKAGTTSLFSYLAGHPDVSMPWSKELDFFSNEDRWRLGTAWYEAQFPDEAVAVGEASPNYTKRHLFPETADRIMATLPGVRLIYLVRDPIERLQSMYVDMLAYGGETRPIDEAVRADSDYVLTSCYGYQLEPFVALSGTENLLVASAARLRDDRIDTLREIYRFLEIDNDYLPAGIDQDINTRAEKRVSRRLGRRLQKSDRYRSVIDADARWSRLHQACFTRPPRRSDVELSGDVLAELHERFSEDRKLLASLLGHDPMSAI